MNKAHKIKNIKQLIDKNPYAVDETLALRIGLIFPIISDLLNQLYPSQISEVEEKLFSLLVKNYNIRNPKLKQIDIERENNPEWFLDSEHIGMMMYVSHFSENLKNFRTKIPYLKELGVNMVHLMPILEVPSKENDGGYAVQNYRKVNKKLGNMEDLEHLVSRLHQENMTVVLDFVLNHCADTHEWAKKAKKGNEKYKNYFYFYKDREVPDKFDTTLKEIFPENAPGNFTYIEEVNEWVMTVFHQYQWDLNYRNPEVLLEMIDTLMFLANKGIDIFRLDAVAFMWKELGTDSQNLPQVHTLLQLFKLCGKIVCPGVAFISEAIVAPEEIIKYLGEGDMQGNECDITYNATLMALCWEALATQNTSVLKESIINLPKKPANTTWINYMRCHDDIGLGFEDHIVYKTGKDATKHRQYLIDFYCHNLYDSWAKGLPFMYNEQTGDARISGSMASLCGLEKAIEENNPEQINLAVQRINMLNSIILSYGGLPVIYSGDEIGLMNDYSYEKDKKKKHDNRWVHRPFMDWKQAERRSIKNTPENLIFNNLKHLIQLRKNNKIFNDYNSVQIEESFDDRVLAYLRWNKDGNRILVICNFSGEAVSLNSLLFQKLKWSRGEVSENIINNTWVDTGNYILRPYEFVWLKE